MVLENTDVVAYDRRRIKFPYVQVRQWEQFGDPEEVWKNLLELTCKVVGDANDRLILQVLDFDLRLFVRADGTIESADGTALDSEFGQKLLARPKIGLRWQGDIPSAIVNSPYERKVYIRGQRSGGSCFPNLSELRIPVYPAFLNGMANQLEALIPLLEEKTAGADLGHAAAIRAMIQQARDMTHGHL